VLCPADQKIGLVLNDENETIGAIWDLDEDHCVRQKNIICDGIGKFIIAKWTGQLGLVGESATSFFVIDTTGMVELSGMGTFFWPQPPSSLLLFGDVSAARFYINGRAEFREKCRHSPPGSSRSCASVHRAQGAGRKGNRVSHAPVPLRKLQTAAALSARVENTRRNTTAVLLRQKVPEGSLAALRGEPQSSSDRIRTALME
jgi:hypothetical protein